MRNYKMDPANYYTTPGLSWDALYKHTGAELELLTDYEMHLFIEQGIRGGISMASKRHAVANSPLVTGHDPEKPPNHILYLDANNLYGWAMCKPLPVRNFKWSDKILGEDDIACIGPNANKGYILEVDLEYEEHNDYPLALEKIKARKEWFPPYQQKLLAELGLSPETVKVMLTLLGKEKYVAHYLNLQLYLSLGMKVKKVHRVLEFGTSFTTPPLGPKRK